MTWKLEEPTLDSANIGGMLMRNRAGLCAYAKCKKPLGPGSRETAMFGEICAECACEVDKFLRVVEDDINREWVASVQKIVEMRSDA